MPFHFSSPCAAPRAPSSVPVAPYSTAFCTAPCYTRIIASSTALFVAAYSRSLASPDHAERSHCARDPSSSVSRTAPPPVSTASRSPYRPSHRTKRE
eukprot:2730274-Rhodomonas_salina.2